MSEVIPRIPSMRKKKNENEKSGDKDNNPQIEEDFDLIDEKMKEKYKLAYEPEPEKLEDDEISKWKMEQDKLRESRRVKVAKKKVLLKKHIRRRMSYWDLTHDDVKKYGIGIREVDSLKPSDGTSQNQSQAKRIYVGSIPNTITEKDLTAFFNAQMITNGLIDKVFGDPVIGCKINYAKSFCFLDLRSESEATKCLKLNGLKLQDCQLRVKRPTDYIPPSQNHINESTKTNMKKIEIAICDLVNPNIMLTTSINNLKKFEKLKVTPTRILVLLNTINIEDYIRDDEYAELKEDLLEELSKYGEVKDIIIPRPHRDGFISGYGRIFVLYDKPIEAKKARDAIAGKIFKGRCVVTMFCEEDRWNDGKLVRKFEEEEY